MIARLGLDLGSDMGWCLWRHDGRIESGMKVLGSGRDGERFYRLRLWLHDTKRRVNAMGAEIGEVIFERVDFIVPGQVYSAHIWGGCWATVTAWCEHHGIEYRGIAVATLKKLATGNHQSPKTHVRDAVNKRLLALQPGTKRIIDHNEADAAALLLFARQHGRERAA